MDSHRLLRLRARPDHDMVKATISASLTISASSR